MFVLDAENNAPFLSMQKYVLEPKFTYEYLWLLMRSC